MRKKAVLDALMPLTRQRVLGLVMSAPDRWWYLSELASALRISPSSLQRELDSLTAAAILLMRRDGRRTYYKANEESAIFPELRGLLRKTTGIAQEVATALGPLKLKTVLALLYGSVARGEERADSDIDLLVVADDVTLEELYRRMAPVERKLQRKVNPTLYTRDEFRRRRRTNNAFLEKVLAGPTITLTGATDGTTPS